MLIDLYWLNIIKCLFYLYWNNFGVIYVGLFLCDRVCDYNCWLEFFMLIIVILYVLEVDVGGMWLFLVSCLWVLDLLIEII